MQKSLISSGINVSSDIIAGDSLGKGVAKIYLKRAVSDGMALAQSNRQVSDSIANAALARFGWKWINQESPVRPVGVTPRFGKVIGLALGILSLGSAVPAQDAGKSNAPDQAKWDDSEYELVRLSCNDDLDCLRFVYGEPAKFTAATMKIIGKSFGERFKDKKNININLFDRRDLAEAFANGKRCPGDLANERRGWYYRGDHFEGRLDEFLLFYSDEKRRDLVRVDFRAAD